MSVAEVWRTRGGTGRVVTQFGHSRACQLVDLKIHQKGFIWEKEGVATMCMYTWLATCILWPTCQNGGLFYGREKGKKGRGS